MGSVVIKLRRVSRSRYALFGPKGNQLSPIFHGNDFSAKAWAARWVSSWYEWKVDYKEIDSEETSGVPESPVRPTEV